MDRAHTLQVMHSHYQRPLLNKTYVDIEFPAIQLEAGERAWLSGPSGSGKSTLLAVIAALLPAGKNRVQVGGLDPHALLTHEQGLWRGRNIGFLSQVPQLIPSLSVQDNIRCAAWAARMPWDEAYATSLLADLGVSKLRMRRARELSRGQAQRVALARAMLLKQSIVLADEPTANLDDTACNEVLGLLHAVSMRGTTVLMASHDSRIAAWAQQTITMPQQGSTHAA